MQVRTWWQRLCLRPADGLIPLDADHSDRDNAEEIPEFVASFITWHDGSFDDLIEDVAYDQISCVTFLSIPTGQIYAPYGGVADLFLDTFERRDELSKRWEGWLSGHRAGL